MISLLTNTSFQYSCPEVGLDFNGNDIGQLYDISNWEECGMLLMATSEN